MGLLQNLSLLIATWPLATCLNLTIGRAVSASNPTLYGLTFEEFRHSGDGGVYAQLLQASGFQGNQTDLSGYYAVGDAVLERDERTPLSQAIHSTVKLTPSKRVKGGGFVGIGNDGYYGMRLVQGLYTSTVQIKGTYNGPIVISVSGRDGRRVYGTAQKTVRSNRNSFTEISVTLSTYEVLNNASNTWRVTFDATKISDGHLHVGLPQLFAPTFNNHANGLNNEIAQTIGDVHGSFLRFPGGTNLLGQTVDSRWKWDATIGPLPNRPGRIGTWGYPNTDGLGLLEFLVWCEDMRLEPILAVWDGLTQQDPVVSGEKLRPYVQSTLNELQYIMGPTSTKYGALRARHGHPAPFKLNHIEIGNEDWNWNGATTAQARFDAIYQAIHRAYPHLTFIASTSSVNGGALKLPRGVWQDAHIHDTPANILDMVGAYDKWPRDQPLFIGEFSAYPSNKGKDIAFQTQAGATCEGAFLISLERNSDVIKGVAYSPLIERFEQALNRPTLLKYGQGAGVSRQTSYFVFQALASVRGDKIHEVRSDVGHRGVVWSATSKGKEVYLKLANAIEGAHIVTVQFPRGKTSATVTTVALKDLTKDGRSVFNDAEERTGARVESVRLDGQSRYTMQMPEWSVVVIAAT